MDKQILIHKVGKDSFRADPTWMPGSPTVGVGETRIDALLSLLNTDIFDIEVVIDDDGSTYNFKGRNNSKKAERVKNEF